jgi:metal-responsive CopG/Arc/MetJ family transcriptional regulator
MLDSAMMGRRQVLVQLDDALIRDLDREAKAHGLNRSELIRRAASAYLDAIEEAEKERRMIEAYTQAPQDVGETDAFRQVAVANWPEW